ncbi:probable alpha-ketoglutarate-dependent hypophosphite dioxygenase [Chrysoperla carnea]|uniref:probable alpha-ketoglutarate-dependent hypophosphite dioxygenase n=1 Tax=Chrysoperla carnea TaxID=189513 RepID=UPI001D081041|nr:probable alpha-ketoglutarate-dependent hypophosphite dioxygenase [Chrysoperla carnea]
MVRLTKEQKDFYAKNGFIKLSNIYSNEDMDRLSKEYDDLFTRKNIDDMEAAWKGNDMKKQANFINYSVKSLHNLQMHSSIFTEFITNQNMLEALEDIMGTPNILLHHTKAHLKPPENGAPYLMHQDYHYFPFKNDSMVAVFIHLDDTTPENGGLAVYPGSHLLGPQEDVGVIEKGESYHYLDQKKFPLEKATPISAKKGEIVVFSYLLIHGSYLNLSERTRRMLLVQLMSADDEPLKDVHKSPCQGLVLRGKNVTREGAMAKRFVA